MSALSTRFDTARWIRSGCAADDRGLGGHVDRDSVRPAARPVGHALDDLVEPHLVLGLARLRAARQLDDVRHERGQLVQLGDDVGPERLELRRRQPLRVLERLDVRAQARDRRAQLVARVRHELALRLDGALERVERGVEAARQAAELVLRGHVDPVRGVRVARDLLGAAREAVDRRERGPGHHRGQGGAERHARGAHQQEDQQHAVQLAVHLVERAGHLDGPRLPMPRVRTRTCVPETLSSLRNSPEPLRASARVPASTGSASRDWGGRTTLPDGSTSCAKPSGPPKGSGGRAGKALSGRGRPLLRSARRGRARGRRRPRAS